jgi:hypothetical protein
MVPQNRTHHDILRRAIGHASGFSNATDTLGGLLPEQTSNLADTLTALSQGISTLAPATQLHVQAVIANTQAVAQNTSAHDTSNVLGTIGKLASSLTGGALSLSPILSGLLGLFGSGGASAPPPLVKFALPPRVAFQAANVPGSQTAGMDFGQSGDPRVVGAAAPSSGQQITIHVQAMDSRSFMDHSQDIAKAVRDAMLNMHSLNDVISDL